MKALAVIAALTASPVLAQDFQVFVVEKDVNGVVQYESNVTLQGAQVLMGNTPPTGTTGVILNRIDRTVKWTSDTPEEANKRFGGDGPPYIVDARDPPAEPRMEFDAGEEERLRRDEGDDEGLSDIEFDAEEEEQRRRRASGDEEPSDLDFEDTEDFFPAPDTMRSARIHPRDGFWAIEIRDQTITGCLPGVAEALGPQMAAMNMSGGRGIFGPDFAPQKMAPQLEWTQVGANSWYGSRDGTAGGAGVYIQWGVQVISPTLINHRQALSFGMGGFGTCRVYTVITAFHGND